MELRRYLLPFFAICLLFFFPQVNQVKAITLETLINQPVQNESAPESTTRTEEITKTEKQEADKGFLEEFFGENFDNLKLLLTITFPSAFFFAVSASLKELAEERRDYYQHELERLSLISDQLNRELAFLTGKLEALTKEIASLCSLLAKGGRVVEKAIEDLLEEREQVTRRLFEVEGVIREKFL